MSLYQGGPPPALVKADVPWSARRGHLSEKDRVLKTIKGYKNCEFASAILIFVMWDSAFFASLFLC